MELYPYQKDLISRLYKRLKSNIKRIILYAPTGAGKTVIVSKIIQDARSKDRRILFLVHRNELVEQTILTLQHFNISAGVIKAGWKSDKENKVQVASIQTLNVRGLPNELDIIFIDECHTTTYYKSCKEIFKVHKGIIIGVTATPWRTKKNEGLSSYYQEMVKAPLPQQLIEMKFLVPPVYYGYNNEIDLSQIHTRAGEYALDELDVVCNTNKVLERIVDEYQRLAMDRTTICFAITVEHAKNIAMHFCAKNIQADYIEAATHAMSRSEKYDQLRMGKIKVLCSVGVLTEGFDVRNVNAIIMARPTKSMALNYQMIGRGLRSCVETDKQDCIILDFANNTERHGMVQMMDDVEMDTPLETESKMMTKSCPNCNVVVPLPVMTCPECGFQFQPGDGESRKKERLEDLIKLLPPDEKKKKNIYHRYAQYAYNSGFKPSWAAIKYHGKYRKWPKPIYKYAAVFGDEAHKENQRAYLNYLFGFVESGKVKDPVKYIEEFMQWEFGDRLILQNEESNL